MGDIDYDSDSSFIQYAENNKKRKVASNKTDEQSKAGRPRKAPINTPFGEYDPLHICEFLEEIENAPVLWDTRHADHHRKEVTNKIWDEVEQKCGRFLSRGRVHGNTAKKLWFELLSEYRKERKKMENMPSGSGQYLGNYRFLKNMAFMELDRSNREVKNSFVFACNEENIMPAERKPSTTPKARKSNDNFERLLSAVERGNEVLSEACGQIGNNGKVSITENADLYSLIDECLKDAKGIEKMRKKSMIMNFLLGMLNQEENNVDKLIFGTYDL